MECREKYTVRKNSLKKYKEDAQNDNFVQFRKEGNSMTYTESTTQRGRKCVAIDNVRGFDITITLYIYARSGQVRYYLDCLQLPACKGFVTARYLRDCCPITLSQLKRCAGLRMYKGV